LRHLDYGTLDQKILAVYFMGASKKARFVRPLGRELLDQLDNPDMRQLSVNDPYVKAHIAWALGQIDHKAGVPYLLEALEKTLAIVEEKRQAVQQARQNRSATSHEFIIEQDEPGPFLSSTEMVDPYSPDVYWSVADAFKATPAILLTAEDHRARLRGFNYVNVIQHILIALGKIKDPEVSDRVAQLLDHPYPSIRKEAALTLGKLGNLGSLEALERGLQQRKGSGGPDTNCILNLSQ
jgi:HEAT repeat protein